MIEKEILNNLYFTERKSVKEIAALMSCSSGRIFYWMEKYKIQRRSRSVAIYLKNNPIGDPFCLKKIKNTEDAKLLGLGLGLYWGEGNRKNKNTIRLGNTNPLLINAFLRFLIVILGIRKSKLRFGLQIFSDISEEESVQFWLREMHEFGIVRKQFFKVTITPSRGIGNYLEKSQYGVLTVYYCNSKLKKILDSMLPM